MKKTILTLCALTFAAPAMGNHPISIEDAFAGQEFETRGQCQAALMRERNARRQAGGETANRDYNAAVKRDYVCEENEEGMFVVDDLGTAQQN